MNLEKARLNMVEQQVRPWDVLDNRVLEVMREIPRENFFPASYRKLAYSDTPVPIGENQVSLVPREVARALQALDIKKTDKCLEIGCGTGYITTLMGLLGKSVLGVERNTKLLTQAKQNTDEIVVLDNVALIEGDGGKEWSDGQPFDVIFISGSFPVFPDSYKTKLKNGGRMFLVVGQAPAMQALLVTRIDGAQYRTEVLFETDIPELVGCQQPEKFEF